MAANISEQEVLEMIARDAEMDIDVEKEANEEVTLTERVEECLKEFGDANINVDFWCRSRRVNASPTVLPKPETISFSSLRPAKQLLLILSGLTEREVV